MRRRSIKHTLCLLVLLALAVPWAEAAQKTAALVWKNPAPNTATAGGSAMELQVELNRLGSAGDPIEREELLRRIVDQCAGTEEAEAAYWALSDLYLDAFSEPREQDARDILELFLKRCPESRYAIHAKCRLLALYDAKDKRVAELRKELGANKDLPQMLRSALKL